MELPECYEQLTFKQQYIVQGTWNLLHSKSSTVNLAITSHTENPESIHIGFQCQEPACLRHPNNLELVGFNFNLNPGGTSSPMGISDSCPEEPSYCILHPHFENHPLPSPRTVDAVITQMYRVSD